MKICCSAEEVEISGKPDELIAWRLKIRTFLDSDSSAMTFEADTHFDPHPYNQIIPRMIIEKTEGLVKVSVTDEREVTVSGSPERLESFESYFVFSPDAAAGEHTHFEYYEGHPVIAPGSIPLVISVR